MPKKPGSASTRSSGTFNNRKGALLLGLGVLLGGCAGYHLGPTNGERAGERSVQVNPFRNATPEPRLSEAVTTSLRKRLQQDGTYRLNTRDEADIIVTGEITHFERSQLSFQPQDILTPRDYQLKLLARVIARERLTGKVLFDRPVSGHTTIRVGNDLSSAERQAVPLMADDLARNVTAALVEGVW